MWKAACQKVPFSLGTDCKSLYDTCIKPASTTKDKRVALDLLDVHEGIEYLKDSIRWVPTDHMLVDCLTKAMHPSLLNKYMTDYLYSFKYDDQLHASKRATAKERKQQREERLKQGGKKQVSRASCPIGAPSSPRSMCNVAIRDERGRESAQHQALFCVSVDVTLDSEFLPISCWQQLTSASTMPSPPSLQTPPKPRARLSAMELWDLYDSTAPGVA